jgi:hypothetical protein
LENNIITGSGYAGVYVSAGYSNNTITFTNNTIKNNGKTSNLEYAVNIAATGGNNTITFTKNNIIGDLGYGVYIYGIEGDNTIIFINNTIKGDGKGDAVYMMANKAKNNITFTKNNITGLSTNENNFGTFLYLDNSNNTVNFTKNNFKSLNSGFAAYIHSTGGNNSIVFTKNDFFGKLRGLSLVVDYANNNISITKNNFTGTDYAGVILYPQKSTNTLLSFVGNNFTSNKYAFILFSDDPSSGISLINNTFKSEDIGILFECSWYNDLTNFNITGNTIIAAKKGISFEKGGNTRFGVTVNYNRIIAPIGLDFTGATNNNSNFNYNWWGINDISSKIIGFTTDNHYLLNIINLTSLDHVTVGDKVKFVFLVLNTTMTNEGVENLPYFVITGTFNGIAFESLWDNGFIHELTITQEGLEILTDHLDEQDVQFSFEGFVPDKKEPEGPKDPDNEDSNNPNKESPENGPDFQEPDMENPDMENPDMGNDIDSEDDENSENKAKKIPKNISSKAKEIPKNISSKAKNTNLTMEPTGVPIAILLILAIFALLTFRRKNK